MLLSPCVPVHHDALIAVGVAALVCVQSEPRLIWCRSTAISKRSLSKRKSFALGEEEAMELGLGPGHMLLIDLCWVDPLATPFIYVGPVIFFSLKLVATVFRFSV